MARSLAQSAVKVCILLAAAISSCRATPVTFTNETLFDEAIGGNTLSKESFESVPSSSDPFTFPTVKVSCTGGSTCTDFFGPSMLMPSDGTRDVRFSGTDTLTFSWDTPITVFAIDIRDLGTNGPTDLIVTITRVDGTKEVVTVFSNYTGAKGNTLFLGILDDEGIASLSVTSTAPGDGIYLDRLQTAEAPEPSTAGLVFGGLTLLGLARKARAA
jgi:hypothetical protein